MTEGYAESGAISGLDDDLAAAQAMAAAFRNELEGMRVSMAGAGAEMSGLTRSIASSLRSAFKDLVFEGAKLSDVLKNLALSISQAAWVQAMKPVENALAGLIGSGIQGLLNAFLPFEKGGVLSSGRVTAFANGGVVEQATRFAMRAGTVGLMGEAGPEAIMPLARGADGKLGVRSDGRSSVVNINMQVSTPDVTGFQRSRSQIAAQMIRAMGRGRRNL